MNNPLYETDRSKYFFMSHLALMDKYDQLKQHVLDLKPETLTHFKIGYDEHFRPRNDRNFGKPVIVVPYNGGGFSTIDTRSDKELRAMSRKCKDPNFTYNYAKDHRKESRGTLGVFNADEASQEDIIFVFANPWDVMVFWELTGIDAIALGNENWVNRIYNLIHDDIGRWHDKKFVLMLDGTPDGQKANKEIKKKLCRAGIDAGYLYRPWENSSNARALVKAAGADFFVERTNKILDKVNQGEIKKLHFTKNWSKD